MSNAPKEDNLFDEIADAAPDSEAPADASAPEAEAPAAETPEDSPAVDMTEAETGPDLDGLIAERDDLKDRLLRALAESENARKRAAKDRREAEAYGGTRIARDMLPVYDNLKRALDAADDAAREGASGLVEGVELTLRELLNILEKHGVTRITPEAGEAFDAQLHEAMFEAPVPDVPKGHIIQVMTEGFMLHDRLLRPAQVGVSSAP